MKTRSEMQKIKVVAISLILIGVVPLETALARGYVPPAVDKDELIVKVQPAQAGQAGRDVFGHSIASPKAQASDLRAGRNVRWDAEGSAFHAERKRLGMLGSTMTHKQRETVTKLEFKIFESQEQYDQLTEQRKALAAQVMANKDACIIIVKQVNPGTVLRVLDSQLEIQNALLGPIPALPDPITRNLTLTSVDTATKE